MIRYREGKIVSTKGERFSQVTKEESEEMKKSIVNMNSVAETILTACPAPPPPINTDYPPSLLYLDPDSANLYKHLDLRLRFEIRPTSDKLDQALPTPSILGR